MDSYFLFVFKGLLSEQQKTLACDHIQSMLPSRHDYEVALSFASPVAPMLRTGNSYVAVLNPLADADLKWMKFSSDDELLSTLESLREPEAADTSEFDLISAHIHELADLLPTFGSYKLDIFITSDILEVAPIGDMPALASALYCLQWWHGARTKILPSYMIDSPNIQSWLEIMDATVLGEKSQNAAPSLWRGCIELQSLEEDTMKIHCHGFELQLDRHRSGVSLLPPKQSKESQQEAQQSCICSPILQVVDECDFASIPPYLLSPLICKVSMSDANCWNEESWALLDHMASRKGMTLILRMAVSDHPGGAEPDRSRRTDRWRRALSSNNVSHPKVLAQFDRHITLALTMDSGEMIAYPLRGVESLRVDPFYSILSNFHRVHKEDSSEEHSMDIGRLPIVDAQVFTAFIRVLKSLRKESIEKDKSDHPPAAVGAEVCLAALSEMDILSTTVLDTNLKVLKVAMDPSDWRERVVLLHKQMKSEQTKSMDPTNVLKDPALLRQNVSLSIQEIQERFQPSGEAKDGLPLLTGDGVHKSQEDIDQTLQKWPDALQCTHDGIYYNIDSRAEEKESLGNRMVGLYVRQETVGACVRAVDLPPDSPLRKPFALSSELRSFMDRGRRSFESSEKKRSETESRTDAPTSKSETDARAGKSVVGAIRKLARKGSAPVRCSPRKKVAVRYGSEQRRAIPNKSKEVKVQNKSAQELPDILRKKLRAAVATALEGQGIQLDDPFFRPCGKRLFTVCQAFVQDLSGQKGSMSQKMQKVAEAHVKQVIEYERQKESGQ